MKVPADKTITFTFASWQHKDKKSCWAANLVFPAGAGPDDPLPVAVESGECEPVAEGTLVLAGREIAISAGAGSIRYADFVAGKHSAPIILRRPGMESVRGFLTFA